MSTGLQRELNLSLKKNIATDSQTSVLCIFSKIYKQSDFSEKSY